MEQLEPKLFADGFMFLEAPKWHDGRLWVSDVFDHKVYALSSRRTSAKRLSTSPIARLDWAFCRTAA